MYQAAKEKQTSKILLPLLSTWKKGTNHKWGGKGVTRQNGSYETKTKTIIKTNTTIDTETKQIWKRGTSHKWGGRCFNFVLCARRRGYMRQVKDKHKHKDKQRKKRPGIGKPQMGRGKIQYNSNTNTKRDAKKTLMLENIRHGGGVNLSQNSNRDR